MRKIGFLSAAAAAGAVALLAPLTASATQAAAPRALARCEGGTYATARYDVNIYSGWNSYRVIANVAAGYTMDCVEGVTIGRRYTACDQSDGNGWLEVILSDHKTHGWTPQACWRDQV